MADTNLQKNRTGYGYKYTDLAQIHEYLEKNNMSYYQYIEIINGNDYIMTVPIKDGVVQEPRRGVRIVDAVLTGIRNPAQEQGSAITYARRYSLLMAFGLATEDDDAQSLTRSDIKKNSKSVTKKENKIEANITEIDKPMNFGKYKNKTWIEVYSEDVGYLEELVNTCKSEKGKKVYTGLIKKIADSFISVDNDEIEDIFSMNGDVVNE